MDKIDEILRDIDKPEGPDGITIASPYDAYHLFKNRPKISEMFGKYTLEDVDNYVKSVFKKECWPKHLKEEKDEVV